MKIFHSIRFRLTAWYAIMLLVGVTLFGAVIGVAGHYALMASTDARLEDRVSRLAKPLARDFEETEQAVLRIAVQPELAISVFPEAQARIRGLRNDEDRRQFAEDAARSNMENKLRIFAAALPAGDFLSVQDSEGAFVVEASVQEGVPAMPASTGLASDQAAYKTIGEGRKQYRVLQQTVEIAGEPYGFVTGASTAPLRAVRRQVLSSLRWLAPLFLIFSVAGGYWLSDRALKPIDEITMAARSIGIRDLSQRLDVAQTDDELRRLTETWNGMLARMEAAVRQLRQFTADASHELRTPTAAVRATAELALRRERSADEYRAAIGKMYRETGRMAVLIDDLLMLARADQSEEAMPTCPVDLDELVAEACDDYEILAEQKSVRLQRALEAPGIRIEANKAALRRLLVVLLDNAIKYSPEGGAAGVSTSVGGDAIVLAVRDDGPGIPADALPHLFDRFYRSDSSRARSVGGAGLGLALAKSIADVHHARITASNRAEGGAVFSVEIPFGRAAAD